MPVFMGHLLKNSKRKILYLTLINLAQIWFYLCRHIYQQPSIFTGGVAKNLFCLWPLYRPTLFVILFDSKSNKNVLRFAA